MTTFPAATRKSIIKALESFRPLVINAGEAVQSVGWEDVAEALADIDVTCAALLLGRHEGDSRARILLAKDGPLLELATIVEWDVPEVATRVKPAELLSAA